MWWRQGPDHECFPLCTCASKAALVPLNNEAPYNSSQHCLQVQSCQTRRLPTWPPASLTSCSSRPCRLYFVPQDSHSRAVHIFQRSGPLSLPFFVPQSSWQPNMWLTQNTLQVLPNVWKKQEIHVFFSKKEKTGQLVKDHASWRTCNTGVCLYQQQSDVQPALEILVTTWLYACRRIRNLVSRGSMMVTMRTLLTVMMMLMTMVLRRKTCDVKEEDLIISPKNCSHWL